MKSLGKILLVSCVGILKDWVWKFKTTGRYLYTVGYTTVVLLAAMFCNFIGSFYLHPVSGNAKPAEIDMIWVCFVLLFLHSHGQNFSYTHVHP